MGTIILLVTFFVEVGLVIYCIKTKQDQKKLRSQIWIAGWLTFVGATLTSIIEWSFRWYFLFAILSVFAVLSGFRLYQERLGRAPGGNKTIGKKAVGDQSIENKSLQKKPYGRGRVILRGSAVFLLIAFALTPALLFPQYKAPAITGTLQVQTAGFTFTDAERLETFSDTEAHRKLNVAFWYPVEADETYPLILFSHGAFGVKSSNTSTFMALASSGYVVCSVDHPYHAAGTVDAEGTLTIGSRAFMEEVLEVNGEKYDEQAQYAIFNKWMTLRTGDLNFVLDHILEKPENTSAEIYNRIDPDKIGLMGHSLGGAASAQLGRDRYDIRGVINLDGSMLGEYQLDADGDPVQSNRPYPLPLLNFYSEDVLEARRENPEEVYINHHISSISPAAYETYVKGSNHMSYTDLPLFSPFLANQLSSISGGSAKAKVDATYCIETMNQLVLEFFDCFVKDKGVFEVEASY